MSGEGSPQSSATVPEEWNGERLDRFLSEYLDLCNRSQLKSRGVVARVDGTEARLSRKLHAGELVEAILPPLKPSEIRPERIGLPIIYEDHRVVVVNKPQGLVVHPGAGNPGGTLANALAFHSLELRESFREEGKERPGIVHRLDKETSGVIIAAKDPETLAVLSKEFKRRRTEKRYIAILRGRLPRSEGSVEGYIRRDPHNRKRFVWSPVEGKAAETGYRVLRHLPEGYTLVRFEPKSGRTHQLRVHAAHLHAPILGDPVYSRRDQRFPRATMMLHAFSLRITLPGDEVPRLFRAPLPARFREVLTALRGDSLRETP